MKALQAFHILRQGAAILTAVFLAKSTLGTDVIGDYEKLLYISYTVSFFWVSGLTQGLLSSYEDMEEDNKQRYLFNAYLLFTGISLLLFLLMSGFESASLRLFTGQGALNYYFLFLVYLFLNMPTYLVENFYLLFNQPEKILLFGGFSFGMHLLVMLVPVFAGWGFEYSFYGLIALAAAKHLWLLGLLVRHGKWEYSRSLMGSWLLLSAPLMGYALLGGLMQAFDNWLVNFWYDGNAEQFAIFRYGAREVPLALALAAAFNAAMLPEVRKDLSTALEGIKTKSLKLFHLLFPLSIVLLLISDWLFPVVFNPEFADSAPVFNTFLLIITSRLIFSRTVLIGLQDNNTVLLFSLMELLVNIGLSFLFIRSFGLVGVAIGSVIAYLLEKALISWYLYEKYKITPSQYLDLRWWGAYSLILLVVYFFV